MMRTMRNFTTLLTNNTYGSTLDMIGLKMYQLLMSIWNANIIKILGLYKMSVTTLNYTVGFTTTFTDSVKTYTTTYPTPLENIVGVSFPAITFTNSSRANTPYISIRLGTSLGLKTILGGTIQTSQHRDGGIRSFPASNQTFSSRTVNSIEFLITGTLDACLS